MAKRTIQDIKTDLDKSVKRLKDVQEKGDAAISKYDLMMGYDADYYLNRTGLLYNHIKYYNNELVEASKYGEQTTINF